jgi:hypothetical protein
MCILFIRVDLVEANESGVKGRLIFREEFKGSGVVISGEV